MPLKPPSWWYRQKPIPPLAWGLWPISKVYGAAVSTRFVATKAYRSKLPVICIGNFTLGGAGKTPIAIKLATLLRDSGWRPAFLTRGYGGTERGPREIDAGVDHADAVGDEPLLLAKTSATVVSRRRADGARLLETLNCDVIVMDDGFQNPSLHKDVSIIVIDAGVGLGSGFVFPFGPLRAPVGFQAKRADAIISLSAGKAADVACPELGVPIFRANIVPTIPSNLGERPLIAFCGIGRPGKFYDTLAAAGLKVGQHFSFPDHHQFSQGDALLLLDAAAKSNAALITTEKDQARLRSSEGALGELYAAALTLPITVRFSPENEAGLLNLIYSKIRR